MACYFPDPDSPVMTMKGCPALAAFPDAPAWVIAGLRADAALRPVRLVE